MNRVRNLASLMLFFFALPLFGVAQEEGAVREGIVIEFSDTLPESRAAEVSRMRSERGLIDLKKVFVPQRQIVIGLTGSYLIHENDGAELLVIEDINSMGYSVKASPMVGYAIADNMVVGARFRYKRNLLRLDNASFSYGEGDGAISLGVKDYYAITHSYTGSLIWRQYIPLGRNRRFALFNEMLLEVGGSQSKFAFDTPVKGTYATSLDVGIGVEPGIVAFATNNVAFEVSVGVLGLSYSHTKQVHNQVYQGDASSALVSFKINLLAIGLGVSFYF